ncbi:hypothetical protein ACOSQ4_028431 [Xanthoceras sorbifolium]
MRTARKTLNTCLRRTQATRRRRTRKTAAATIILRRRAQARAAACRVAGRRSTCSSKVVSDKLEALKNLIPGHVNNKGGGGGGGGTVKADELFQETADYIVLLKTRVVVLQSLIQFYGSMEMDNQNVVIL